MKAFPVFLLVLALAPLSASAETLVIQLFQRYEVMAQQQRLVGNMRTLAKTDGIVVNVPQLYVYHVDQSAAFHLGGFRPGFERELELVIDRRRGERSMVRLDRLLERTKTPDGGVLLMEELPPADVTLALYRQPDCDECDLVEAALREWIASNPERSVLWLAVRTDPPRGL